MVQKIKRAKFTIAIVNILIIVCLDVFVLGSMQYVTHANSIFCKGWSVQM